MKKIILLIIALLLFISCATRNKISESVNVKTVYDTIVKHDSVLVWKEKIVIAPSQNTELISYPCDSSGNLKVIEKVIRIPQGLVKVSNDNGNLRIEAVTDSIISYKEKQYESKYTYQNRQITELQQKNTALVKTSQVWKITSEILVIALFISLIYNVIYYKRKI